MRGALRFLIRKLRTQREAWYEKGFEEDILVGEDELGNKYWQSAYTTAGVRTSAKKQVWVYLDFFYNSQFVT